MAPTIVKTHEENVHASEVPVNRKVRDNVTRIGRCRFKDAALHTMCSRVVTSFETIVFFQSVLSERGAANQISAKYHRMYGGESPKSLADKLGKYRKGKNLPGSICAWQFAAATRRATRHDWCAGPVLLYLCEHLTDFVAVFRWWREITGENPAQLLRALPSAVKSLPSDYNPSLAWLFELSQDDINADIDLQNDIRGYVEHGVIADFEVAKRQYEERQRARAVWTFPESAHRLFDRAWHRVKSARILTSSKRRSMIDGLAAPEFEERGLIQAYAVAEALWAPHRQPVVLESLLEWSRAMGPSEAG